MTILNVQHHLGADGSSSVVASVALTGSAVASGNLVVGAVQFGSSASQTVTVADDKGNTYNLSTSGTNATDTQTQQIFWLNNITNAPSTITASFHSGSGNTSAFVRMLWAEFSGISTSSGTASRDGETAQSPTPGTGTDAQTSGTITTGTNGDLIFSAFSDSQGAGATWSAGTGFTILDNGLSSNNDNMGSEWQVQSSAGSIAGTFTENVSSRSVVGVIAFKAAGGGATVATIGDSATQFYAPKLGPKFKFKPQLAFPSPLNQVLTLPAVQGSYTLTGNAQTLFNGTATFLSLAAPQLFAPKLGPGNRFKPRLAFPPGGQVLAVSAAQGAYILTGNAQTLSNEIATFRGLAAPKLFSPMLGPKYRFSPRLAFPPGSQALTLPAVQGTYVVTGQAQTLNAARVIGAAEGTYALTGQTQTLNVGMPASQGAYTLTGQVQALNRGIGMAAVQGSYTLNGQVQSLLRGRPIVVAQGSYALNGQPQSFAVALSIQPVAGVYSLSGQGIALAFTPAGGGGAVSHSNPFFATPGPGMSLP